MPTRRYKRPPHLIKRAKGFLLSRHVLPRLLTAVGIIFLWVAGTVIWWSRDLPDPQNIGDSQLTESTKIYDASGTHLLYEIGEVRRTIIPLQSVSPYVTQATLAAEDDQFYEHNGLDWQGILRGTVLKPLSGQRVQGGSTITQQLIKNSILTSERTLRRKAKEAVLALELEQRFSKDDILQMYLNTIPYGSRAYGVEAAAQTFFGTSSQNVSLAQATILAALPKAPTYYSPHGSRLEDLKIRQEHILNRMVGLGMVSTDEAERAKREELTIRPPQESIGAPHFVFYVKELLEEEYGERVVDQGGLKVTTTLDARLQLMAEEVLKEASANLNSLGASNASLVAINPKNGDILAMAGSLDYFNQDIDGNVNVAVRHRSPGSSIKPFIYAAAFAKGYTPDTILVDAETDFGRGYKPKDYDKGERGPVTMRAALGNSLNIPAVQTLYLAGVKASTDLAQRMGMESLNDPDRYGLSLVLGGGEVRLLDLTSAYGVFATDGVRYPHRAILKVEDSNEILFDATQQEPAGNQVLDAQIARLVTNIISDNNARSLIFGARSPLQLGSRPVAAKTGTAQDYRDGWTAGFTPSLAVGVWTGNNDNSPMGSRSDGVRTAGPIWNAFMRRALEGTTVEQFTKPEPLRDIPHAALRGQMPEVKGKWDEETKSFYTPECPTSQGEPRTFKELHSILFYVQRNNPLGPSPVDAESDPQFERWEAATAAWSAKHNEKVKSNPEEPLYTDSLPVPSCNVGNEDELPRVRIIEPNTTVLEKSPVTIEVEVASDRPLREVRFLIDGQEAAKRKPDEPLVASLSFPDNFSGRKTLLVLAITEDNVIGRAHRTFIINPDDSSPKVTLHTPADNAKLSPTNFPQTIKVTATDPSDIEAVDVLFDKTGASGARRIGRTAHVAATAPNRYEVTWEDSPGPGTYRVYAIAYDKTGNFTESARHHVTIE